MDDNDLSELPSSSLKKSENDEKLSSKCMDSDSPKLYPMSELKESSSKSKDFDSPELPTSFAKISEHYENSRNEDTYKSSEVSQESVTNYDQRALSLISSNYQDTSSEEDEDSEDCENDDDDKQSIVSESSTRYTKEDFDVRTKGELSLSDLPPIEDLKISVDEEKCEPVGCIKSIVDTLVIVEAFLNHDALDIDSVLFVDRGQRALGKIFDVFGPVNKPYYAVRFNDANHIKRFSVQIKEPVYCAPQTEYANYIVISQLLEQKGSDASWKDNNEPPPELLDYSDDEAERLAKKKRKKRFKADENNTDREKTPEPPSQNTFQNNINNNSTLYSSNTPPNRRLKPTNNPQYQNFNNERTFPTYAQLLGSVDHTRPRSANYSHHHHPNSVNYNRPLHPNSFSYSHPSQSNSFDYHRPPQPNSFNYSRPPQPNSFNYSRPPQPNSFNYSRPSQPNSCNYSHRPQHKPFDYSRPLPPNLCDYGYHPRPNSFDYSCPPQPNYSSYNNDQNNYITNAPDNSYNSNSYTPSYRMSQPPNDNNPVNRPPCPYPNPAPYHGPRV
ncbi:Hypothetical protein CINCED_3A018191 [Cinara cedri]|uniref:H/ACA ribonucleoprotein complex non-core subunit NAF1 n=1 Tax=Cinara cedri TaxID=506608 RepID=A0A5E4NE97_9HEMI|nr:Hypothetical protein CINCED_3A018191 [Cinara cedri]